MHAIGQIKNNNVLPY